MSEFKDFVYTNDEALSENQCNEIIDYVNENREILHNCQKYISLDSYEDKIEKNPEYKLNIRDDLQYFLSYTFCDAGIMNKIITVCQGGINEYCKKYPTIMKSLPNGVHNPDIKYHIVKAEGGYHAWHSEWISQSPDDKRVLVWHISLTSHENEGELEFLYQKERIPPKAGRLLIWPAFFPWLHRGNAIRSDKEKHYLTGWFYMNN